MGNRVVKAVAIAMLTLAVAACNREAPPAASTTPATRRRASGRVCTSSRRRTATRSSRCRLSSLAATGVTVAAVPPGELKPEQVRAKMTHYHLGTDTDCLPAGTAIPKADPWIHFGDGKNVIEMSLAPGAHRIAVQAGDDLHRTIAGLCEVD